MLNLSIEIATVANTNATETASLFEREWKNLSIKVKINPDFIINDFIKDAIMGEIIWKMFRKF